MAARVDGFQPAKLRPVSAAVIAPIDSRAAAGGTTGILIGMSKAVVGGKGGAKIIGEEG